jgi:low affinity Fe/Cu permease
MNRWFHRFAARVAHLSGTAPAFLLALAAVLVWGISGPFLRFSQGWQLTINTATTIITFLMVFLIQHSQNTQEEAMQQKLDELIRALPDAKNELRGIEGKE